MTTTLRPGTADDAEAVADLWHDAWHDAHAGHVPEGLTAARTREGFRTRTPSRTADTTVAEVDGVLAGFTMVLGDEVEQVFVASRFRGRDVAGLLLDAAESHMVAAGHAQTWLAVVDGNARARRFYEKRGWRDGGRLPYEVEAGGETFVSPCRRYVKDLGRRA